MRLRVSKESCSINEQLIKLNLNLLVFWTMQKKYLIWWQTTDTCRCDQEQYEIARSHSHHYHDSLSDVAYAFQIEVTSLQTDVRCTHVHVKKEIFSARNSLLRKYHPSAIQSSWHPSEFFWQWSFMPSLNISTSSLTKFSVRFVNSSRQISKIFLRISKSFSL